MGNAQAVPTSGESNAPAVRDERQFDSILCMTTSGYNQAAADQLSSDFAAGVRASIAREYRQSMHVAPENRFNDMISAMTTRVLLSDETHVSLGRRPSVRWKLRRCDDDGFECSICYAQAQSGWRRVVPCGHFFHRTCLRDWRKKANTCPMCRGLLSA
jgi:hypothetical protein